MNLSFTAGGVGNIVEGVAAESGHLQGITRLQTSNDVQAVPSIHPRAIS